MSDEETSIIGTVRRFADDVLAPAASEIDEGAESVNRYLHPMADLGLFGINLPDQWGGIGLRPEVIFEVVALVAGACGSTASMLTANFLATDAILIGGDDDLRGRYLPDAAAGKLLGAFGLTEPRAGSNPADMTTRADQVSGGYHLKGVKHFISNGGEADFVVVFAKIDMDAGHRGVSAFVVDRDTPGFSSGPAECTMGLKGGHVFELSFDCVVPEQNRIGEEGSGFRTAMKALDNGRIEVAAMCVGIAQTALDAACRWSKDRQVGGEPIASFQGLQWMLADMAMELQASRLLALDAAAKRGRGERFSQEAAMAKLHASEMAGRVTDAALQIHGGYGYSRDMPLERYARDVRIMRIYEGSSEIQRNIIAHNLLAGYDDRYEGA
jgi:alkylation response protein AidB-like acyl-CoA dehydrogenase